MARQIKKSTKLQHDKYYTPTPLAKRLIDKTFEIIKVENITHVIEPSAGAGAFSSQIPDSDHYDESPTFYDMYPDAEGIIEQDFRTLRLHHKRGRLFIGNPPFRRDLLRMFLDQIRGMGDFAALILPISYFDNPMSFYQWDTLYEEDLGVIKYSGRDVHCAFIIKARPKHMLDNKMPKLTLNDFYLVDIQRGINNHKYDAEDFDICICTWGMVGKVTKSVDEYAHIIAVKFRNQDIKERVLKEIIETDWELFLAAVAMPTLSGWRFIRELQRRIPELR